MSDPVSGATVTFTPVYQDRFLFVQRHIDDDILGGYRCFPGGKVEVGESIAGAMARECAEETGLKTTGRAFFVDSYLLGKRIGLHFAVEVTSEKVTLHDLQDHAWVRTVAELSAFTPRIPGIDSHLHYILEHLGRLQIITESVDSSVHTATLELGWQSLHQYDLVEQRFLNR